MPQEVHRQANFTGGEIGARFLGRRDLKAYASSMALCENMLPLPQGPIIRRPGMAHVDLIRNVIEPVYSGAATVTAPNGGDGPTLLSDLGFKTTAALAATADYVIAEFDFGVPTEIGLIDLIDFAIVMPDAEGPAEPPPPQFPWFKEMEDGL